MIAVVGAGMGGLAAAAVLARAGRRVVVFEGRSGPGGLAGPLEAEGLRFDAGPYILLDRPGLEWAFAELGRSLSTDVPLRPVEDLYEVEREDGPAVRVYRSLERTAAGFDALSPGAGGRYADHVERVSRVYETLRPLQTSPRPGLRSLIGAGGAKYVPFLLGSLASVLRTSGLPDTVLDALAIWTHVAAQRREEAPSPMAFVPALIHRHGAWLPEGGIHRVPLALERVAREAGATFRYGVRVSRILAPGGRVRAVEAGGEKVDVEAVVSAAGGPRTYLELLDAAPARVWRRIAALPLQSPGVCAYLAVRGTPAGPYLRFRLPRAGLCRLLVAGSGLDPAFEGTARLLGPMDHAEAESGGASVQRDYLETLLREPWWRRDFNDARPVATRTPAAWGADYGLHRDAMNPVMTARFMRRGRMAHRSRVVDGLYLAGSSTHPGQWVSFCAISGILAAQEVLCSSRA